MMKSNTDTDRIISKLGLVGGLTYNLFGDNDLQVVAESEYTEVNEEHKYCDRNICMSNGYNGIGCNECEVMVENGDN